MSETTKERSRFTRFGRWVAELILVFVGVYAAFWLNNYQQHREDAGRRDQILASLEQQLREGIESGKINRATQEQKAAEFRRALGAGEMPPLEPFVFTTDYSPTDWATILQSGGVQLLDVQTLMAVRNDESVIRWGLSRMARYQKLSDELIVPNFDQDISFFYDPATKKLRKRFEIYPQALEATVRFANELERTHTALLEQIQAERHATSLCHSERREAATQRTKSARPGLQSQIISGPFLMQLNQRCLKAWPHLRISLQRFAQHDTVV